MATTNPEEQTYVHSLVKSHGCFSRIRHWHLNCAFLVHKVAVNNGLAQILPQIVDHLTPNGQVPQGDLMAQGLEMLKGKFQA